MAMFIPESVQIQHELKVVNEAYIGDKPIEPMLKQLHKLREPYLEHSAFFDKFINEFNTDPELFKFNRMLEDFFGFKACSITCINDAIVNGCTYPVSFRNFGSGRNLVSTSNGFKFKKEAEYCLVIYVYSGCMLSSDFTDREIMGMILHEIGHNFSSAINGNLCSIRDIQHFISIPTNLLLLLKLDKGAIYSFQNTTKVALRLQEKFKKEYPDLCNFVDHVKGCLNILGFILRELGDIALNVSIVFNPISTFLVVMYSTLKKIIMKAVHNPISLLFKIGGKTDERMSDDFATLYGYGPDNNSFLQKAEELNQGMGTKTVKEVPIFGAIQQLVLVPLECLIYAFDPHPKNIERALDAVHYLEIELDQCKDPKVRKEIKKEIDDLNKILDQYTERNFAMDGTDVRAAYNEALIKIYGGKQNRHVDKLYDKYDQALKNNKL